FRQYLAALVHIISRLPARRIELIIVYLNSNSRGIFIKNGLVVYITAYYKGIEVSKKAKVIH
ncbi:uncharacterized protein BDZ99DRAFT_403183, partial [Mytilinidion resinicola]